MPRAYNAEAGAIGFEGVPFARSPRNFPASGRCEGVVIFNNPVHGVIHGPGWVRPTGNTDFRVTQDFGPTSLTAEPSMSWPGGDGIAQGYYAHFHKGLDLSDKRCGADVLAAHDGKVVVSTKVPAGSGPSSGENYIVIDHGNGWLTAYGHLASRVVTKGATVKLGQKIGTVGDTGNAYGCHLHFGVKSGANPLLSFFSNTNGKLRDPWPLLAQNVTVHPKASGVNIRGTAGSGKTLGALYATTRDDGFIWRTTDAANLGPFSQPRKWGGTVIGAQYTVNNVTGNTWEKMQLDGEWRFVATPLAALSAQ